MACVESLDELEPCGNGNPRPPLYMENVSLDSVRPIGGGKHLRLKLAKFGQTYDGVLLFPDRARARRVPGKPRHRFRAADQRISRPAQRALLRSPICAEAKKDKKDLSWQKKLLNRAIGSLPIPFWNITPASISAGARGVELADRAHSGQKRKAGTPYVTHRRRRADSGDEAGRGQHRRGGAARPH